MINKIREVFETKVYISFGGVASGLRRKPNGEYVSDMLEDHWQTYQEGWEHATEFLKHKKNSQYSDQYSDILSDGGMDPR